MQLIENIEGLFFSRELLRDGRTREGAPFEKDSDLYNEKLEEGFELVLITQAERDAHNATLARDAIIAEIAALDLPSYVIERALAGDNEAIKKIKDNEEKKALIRARL